MAIESFITDHEPAIRLGAFLGIFGTVAVAEIMFPRRALVDSKAVRWFTNLSITFINGALMRLLFPILAVAVAAIAAERGWGLLNAVGLPFWLEVAVAVAVLDFVIYLQHRLFHAVPVLWRLHKMHHVDLDIDVTTGARFHPLEIMLSMLIKFAAVIGLGAAPLAVVIFEVVLNGMAMFNHGNFRLPLGLDNALRLFVVTPDMHRVHHSVIAREYNSNFGFNLSWWDRLMGTYRAQPESGHDGMTIGHPAYRDRRRLTLPWLMLLPFRREPVADDPSARSAP